MSIVTQDKLRKDAEDAEKLLEKAPEEAEGSGIKEEKKEEEEPTVPPKEAKPPIEQAPEVTPPTKLEESETIESLKTQIEGLKLQLADENSPTAQQKYSTLQGMFNKLSEEVKELRKVKEEQEAAPQKPQESVLSNEDHKQTLSNLKQDYGDGLIPLLKDLMKETFNELAGTKFKEYGEKINTLESSQDENIRETFHANLTNQIPDWKQLNGWSTEGIPQDPKFTVFLNKKVPGTTMTYSQVLVNAYNAFNLNSVVEVFNLYKKENKPVQETTPAASTKPNVNDYIEVDTSGGAGAAQQQKQKTYSHAVIDSFYNSITKGTFQGTDAERIALENEYETAMLEGRVI